VLDLISIVGRAVVARACFVRGRVAMQWGTGVDVIFFVVVQLSL